MWYTCHNIHIKSNLCVLLSINTGNKVYPSGQMIFMVVGSGQHLASSCSSQMKSLPIRWLSVLFSQGFPMASHLHEVFTFLLSSLDFWVVRNKTRCQRIDVYLRVGQMGVQCLFHFFGGSSSNTQIFKSALIRDIGQSKVNGAPF